MVHILRGFGFLASLSKLLCCHESSHAFLFFFLEQGLALQPRLTSNLQSCLNLPSAEITGIHHHAKVISHTFVLLIIMI
jgi:hypothetical protein